MIDEGAKLKTMLGYWIKHNSEHGQEFREWASKAEALGEPEASKDMLAAAGEIEGVNKLLSRALERLEAKGL